VDRRFSSTGVEHIAAALGLRVDIRSRSLAFYLVSN